MFTNKFSIAILVVMATALSGCIHLQAVEKEGVSNSSVVEPVKTRPSRSSGDDDDDDDDDGGGGGGGGGGWQG